MCGLAVVYQELLDGQDFPEVSGCFDVSSGIQTISHSMVFFRLRSFSENLNKEFLKSYKTGCFPSGGDLVVNVDGNLSYK